MSSSPITRTTTSRAAACVGREAGDQRPDQSVHERLELGGAGAERARRAEQVLEQRDQHDQHEAVEHRGEEGDDERPQPAAPSRGAPAAAGVARSRTSAVTRGQQRDREDHFLGRDAAVEERAAIAGLVLPQLGGIDEEAIARGQQQPRPRRPGGQSVGSPGPPPPARRPAPGPGGRRRTCSGGSRWCPAWRRPWPACGSGSTRGRS